VLTRKANATAKAVLQTVFFVMVFVPAHSSTLPEGNKLRNEQQKRPRAEPVEARQKKPSEAIVT
jgi:hypothetical protein